MKYSKLAKLLLIWSSAFALSGFYAIGVSHIVEGRFWDGVLTFAITKMLVIHIYLVCKGEI